jgi:hypothetical protein
MPMVHLPDGPLMLSVPNPSTACASFGREGRRQRVLVTLAFAPGSLDIGLSLRPGNAEAGGSSTRRPTFVPSSSPVPSVLGRCFCLGSGSETSQRPDEHGTKPALGGRPAA